MADTPLESYHNPGRILTVDIFPKGIDPAVATDKVVNEDPDRPGVYISTVDELLTGVHTLHFKSGSTTVAIREADFYDTEDTIFAVEVGMSGIPKLGYQNSLIYIDTINGIDGSVVGVNGINTRPVKTWSNALALNNLLKLNRFRVANKSHVNLTVAGADDFHIEGQGYTFNPIGQSMTNAIVSGALFVPGSSVGNSTGTVYRECFFWQHDFTSMRAENCRFSDDCDLNGTSTHLYDCRPGVVGIPTFDFKSSAGTRSLTLHRWSGSLSVKGMAANSTVEISGHGKLTIESNCLAGTIIISGDFTVVDNVVEGFQGAIIRSVPETNPVQINGSSKAAQVMQKIHDSTHLLTVDTADFPASNTQFETDGTETNDNTYLGQAGTWFNASGTPANNGTFFVTASQGTTNNPHNKLKLTVEPLPSVPAAGDVFVTLGARSK